MKAFLKKHRPTIVAFAMMGGLILLFMILGIPCPIKLLTGINCAGCGITRSYKSLLRLDLIAAFEFHPIFWVVPIAIVCFFLLKRFPRTTKAILSVILVLDLAVYFYRLFDPACTIVTFTPETGLIYRFFESIVQRITSLI